MQRCSRFRNATSTSSGQPCILRRQVHTTARGRQSSKKESSNAYVKDANGWYYKSRVGEYGQTQVSKQARPRASILEGGSTFALRRDGAKTPVQWAELESKAPRTESEAVFGFDDGKARESTSANETGPQRRRRRRAIPLPPILQPQEKLRDKVTESREKFVFEFWNWRTHKKRRELAPFSEKLATNPYARALATPVRQCRFTKLRLPNSCLLDFHEVERQLEDGSEKPAIEYLPLSLGVAQMSKKKLAADQMRQKVPQDELDKRQMIAEEITSLKPMHPARWVLCKQEAISQISGSQKTQQSVLSERDGPKQRIIWRQDMADVVLEQLRKVVVKKLSFFVKSRGNAEKRGIVCVPPGYDISRRDDVRDVVCILRLTEPETLGEGTEPPTEPHKELDEAFTMELPLVGDQRSMAEFSESLFEDIRLDERPEDAEARPAGVSTEERLYTPLEQTPDTAPESQGSLPADLFDPTASLSSHPQRTATTTLDNVNTIADLLRAHPTSASPEPAPPTTSVSPTVDPLPPGSTTLKPRHGAHSTPDPKRPTFLDDLKPLGSYPVPHTYIPTVRYRGHRVPLYNLHAMLGPEKVRELVAGSAFGESDWILVTEDLGVVDALVWLGRLAAYCAMPKQDTAMVRL